jgi:polysaccharide deacetylase 2 family uncharacterized protein YibQ
MFWFVVLLAVGGGAAWLQRLGPPSPHPGPTAQQPVAETPAALPPPKVVAPPPVAAQIPEQHPGRDQPGPIADPDPGLEEPAPGLAERKLPRIAEDGRMPMQVYAAGFDQSSRRPRVGLVLAGVGLNSTASEQAIRDLPGPVTLAFSPYAESPQRLLEEARLAEHEYLLSIPMEPESFPLNDPGDHALTTSATPEENEKQLIWALSRFAGYVGATGALGLTRGERFASMPEAMQPVLSALAKRGLLYVDPRPNQVHASPGLPFVWNREVDLVIDEPDDAAAIDAKLAALDQLALQKGSALGLAGAVRPVTVERLAIWANALPAKGLVLTSVSALVQPPAKPSAAQ